MATKYYAVLTNVGAAKLANATALGAQVEITQMAVGDGNGVLPTPNPAQTALVHELRRKPLNSLSIDPNNANQIIAEQVIPEDEGGWWIREIGLFDKDGDMIAVANCAETYKPQLQEGSGRVQVVRMILIVSSTAAVTLKIDPSVVLATRQYVDDQIIQVKSYVDQKMAAHVAAADPHKQYAPKESPALTGRPTAPTAEGKDSSTQIANTAFVQAAIAALVGSSPEALDTLNELAAALGNDPNFATTVTNSLAGKMDKSANGSDIENVSVFLQNLQLGEAAKRDVGTDNNQLPDMSAFGMSRNGQTAWDILPNGMIRQAGTVTLTPVGNFNEQVLGGVTYYTHYYRVNFPRQFPNAQIATLATLASYRFSTQASMAGKSLATHRDTDSGTGVSRTRFTVAYTTPNLGEIPTLHFESIGY
ncbi:Tail fiber protein [Klebsiella pneumoniae]|uniref:phage tail protein n=1 Tax=Klebsiella pneumoniae TaxID=573 RepID=UPI000807FC50|nr:phage tail protein [Klebsiella pneumoniae]SBW70248.1 Tail fiber protein [Klebsiella pneumoniae]SSM21338.1 Tail fiber protein [Klebsiella pneumoniae]